MAETSGGQPTAAGSSSFDLVDAGALLRRAGLGPGHTFLDAACGRGPYTLAARDIVGETGLLYGLDLWLEGIASLRAEAAARGIANLVAAVVDLGAPLPVPDAAVDVALLATVLHDLAQDGKEGRALAELARVLAPGGTLAVLEFRKIDGPPGPPARIRLAADEVEALVVPHGFAPDSVGDEGPYTYLSLFRRL